MAPIVMPGKMSEGARGRSEDIQMDKDDGASESGSFRKQNASSGLVKT